MTSNTNEFSEAKIQHLSEIALVYTLNKYLKIYVLFAVQKRREILIYTYVRIYCYHRIRQK